MNYFAMKGVIIVNSNFCSNRGYIQLKTETKKNQTGYHEAK